MSGTDNWWYDIPSIAENSFDASVIRSALASPKILEIVMQLDGLSLTERDLNFLNNCGIAVR